MRFLYTLLSTSPFWFGLIIFIYVPGKGGTTSYSATEPHSVGINMADMNSNTFWNTADMKKLTIPQGIREKAKHINIQESRIAVKGATVFYREAKDEETGKISILLLHGMRFSSKTWLDLNTIHLLAAMGYRVVAVDLPGYAASPAAKIGDRGDFLDALIKALDLVKPVVVSPSMSGTFALPYLFQHWEEMGGYVPVAPVADALESFKSCPENGPVRVENVPQPLRVYLKPPIPDLECIKLPTLVVYGEHDRSRSSALLSLLPFSQTAEIPNGAHPAYLTNPELWHQLLLNFLSYADAYSGKKE